MTGSNDDLLRQLADIKGLDRISWWPLAPGWWALLALLVVAAIAGAIVYWRRQAYWRSWKGDAMRALDGLYAKLGAGNTQEVAGALSVLMRRIALKCFPRPECAGLQGPNWLRWLSAHDPAGFDWGERGILLTEAPYAPPGRMFPADAVKTLIAAARKWVK